MQLVPVGPLSLCFPYLLIPKPPWCFSFSTFGSFSKHPIVSHVQFPNVLLLHPIMSPVSLKQYPLSLTGGPETCFSSDWWCWVSPSPWADDTRASAGDKAAFLWAVYWGFPTHSHVSKLLHMCMELFFLSHNLKEVLGRTKAKIRRSYC